MNESKQEESSSDEELRPIKHFDEIVFDYIDPNMYSGIMKDVLKNNMEEVSRKIKSGKSVRVIDNIGTSLLHLAVLASKNDMSMIDLLLAHEDIDINCVNFVNATPLLDSIKQGKTKTALHLIKRGAKVNYPTSSTPLHACCKFGLPEVAKCLIEKGADINAPDLDDDTPLHVAICFDKIEMVCLMLYYGAEMLQNEKKLNPFMLSMQLKKSHLIHVLVHYATEDVTVKLNSAINHHIENLPAYIEKVIMSREEDDIYYHPNLQAWLTLLREPEALQLIWQNFHIDRNLNTILMEVFEYRFLNWETTKRNMRVIEQSNEETMFMLNEVSQRYPILGPIAFECRRKKPKLDGSDFELMYEFFSFLLSYNLVVWDFDCELVYELFGFCDLFKLMLQMEVRVMSTPRFNLIPFFIYSIDDLTTLCSRKERVLNRLKYHNASAFFDVNEVLRYTTLPIPSLVLDDQSDEKDEIYNLVWPIPKLVDLARSKAREAICQKYRIRNCQQFYTRLNYLNLPNVAKKLISFQTPIYKVHDHRKMECTKSCYMASHERCSKLESVLERLKSDRFSARSPRL